MTTRTTVYSLCATTLWLNRETPVAAMSEAEVRPSALTTENAKAALESGALLLDRGTWLERKAALSASVEVPEPTRRGRGKPRE